MNSQAKSKIGWVAGIFGAVSLLAAAETGIYFAIQNHYSKIEGQEAPERLKSQLETEKLIAKMNAQTEEIKAETARMRAKNAFNQLPALEQALQNLSQAASQNTYVILADTNHANVIVSDFLYDTAIVKEAAQENIKYVAIEKPTSFQPLFNAFTEGKISRRTFVNVYDVLKLGGMEYDSWLSDNDQVRHSEKLADFLTAAKEENIHVLAVDGLEGRSAKRKSQLPADGRRYLAFANFVEQNPALFGPDRGKFTVDYLVAETLQYNEISKKFNQDAKKSYDACMAEPVAVNDNSGMGGCGAGVFLIEEDPEKIRANLRQNYLVQKAGEKQAVFKFISSIYERWTGSYVATTGEFLSIADPDEGTESQIDRRLGEDTKLAERIMRLTKGQKTLIIYGEGHTTHNRYNLSEALGNAPVIKVHGLGEGKVLISSSNLNTGPAGSRDMSPG